MQIPKNECIDCDRLWLDFGTVTQRYLALVATNPAPLAEILAARNERTRIIEDIRAHEWAAHGGERIMSEAI
ncbi:MAG TPA: hypothetical protein VN428_17355 [Bryobacteraceae bacterium]|nr:hypothetical protein [Bryobacteraceae bacterium]